MELANMSEKQLTVKVLKDLTQSIESLNNYISQQDRFLRENFRTYNSYGPSVYGWVQDIKISIEQLERISMSNADNAHLLDKEFDSNVGKDENGHYRRGEVPQKATKWTTWNMHDPWEPGF